jgi:hypothetical protein
MTTRTPEIEEAIRRRAQQLYEQRGCTPGHEVEDWLQAESEILKESQPDPAYVKVRFEGVTYTGEYDRKYSDGYARGEFRPGSAVEIRFDSDKMFVKRPNGKELQTRIVRKENPAEFRPWP